MSDNIDELRRMLTTFRVSELQMLLGYAGRNKTGRKNELQQRALELLRVRSQTIQHKIKELYNTIQANALSQIRSKSPSPTPDRPLSPAGMRRRTNIPRGVVNPFSMETHTGGVNTRAAAASAAMYHQNNMYHQSYPNGVPNYAPPNVAAQQQQEAVAAAAAANSNCGTKYPVHPDVEFKPLPFYDTLAILIKPSTLRPKCNNGAQECNFFFHLTPQQANEVAQSRDVRPGSLSNYIKQIQMRFCLMETSCKQEDFFPPGVIVKVNGKQCPLPNPVPTNKPGVDPKRPPRPVNITPYVKLSPVCPNMVDVHWIHNFNRVYAVMITLVHKRTPSDLLQRMRSRGPKHPDITRGLIQEKLNEDGDNEIATTSLRVSLMCPLGKMRMTNPCRAKTCSHLQCFDASLFLQMNERKPTWTCPVCDKPALYEDLDIDGYFQVVLNSPEVKPDTKEVQLLKDGSWSVQEEGKPVVPMPTQPSHNSSVISIDDSIQIIDDDPAPPCGATSSTDKDRKPDITDSLSKPASDECERTVVDLTLSDSDDDDMPLAKRRAIMTKADSTIKFSDTTSISSSSNQSRVSPVTPGPSSVSSSGCPVSPSAVIAVDSPSPPPLPTAGSASAIPDSDRAAPQATPTPPPPSSKMPYLDAESDAENLSNYLN